MRHVKRAGKVARALAAVQQLENDCTLRVSWVRATGATPTMWVVILEDGRHFHFDPHTGDVHRPSETCCHAAWWSLQHRWQYAPSSGCWFCWDCLKINWSSSPAVIPQEGHCPGRVSLEITDPLKRWAKVYKKILAQ